MSHALNPGSLLTKFVKEYKSGALEITSGLVSWRICIADRQLVYASYSVEGYPQLPVTRVKQYLERLKYQGAIAVLEKRFQDQSCRNFDTVQSPYYLDYPVLVWLLLENHLPPTQMATLASQLFSEALEHLLCVSIGTYRMIDTQVPSIQGLYQPDLPSQVKISQNRLQVWKKFSPQILSIYQRLYLIDQNTFCDQNTQAGSQVNLRAKLAPALRRGYSFWHLAAFLRCHELEIARFLYPHIAQGSIQLREPIPPFDKLPRFYSPQPVSQLNPANGQNLEGSRLSFPFTHALEKTRNSYAVACIDDSPNTLNQIENCLDKDNFSVFKFSEPVKALFQISKINPDIIFLDIGMPKVNGYALCRMFRNHPSTRETPIVVVSGNRGILNKSKAKSAGASDYITKPFTKSDLLDVVVKYVSKRKTDPTNS